MHQHMFRVVRARCTPTYIHFVCACGVGCKIWRNTYNLLVKMPVRYWYKAS